VIPIGIGYLYSYQRRLSEKTDQGRTDLICRICETGNLAFYRGWGKIIGNITPNYYPPPPPPPPLEFFVLFNLAVNQFFLINNSRYIILDILMSGDIINYGTNIYTYPSGLISKLIRPLNTSLVNRLREQANNTCRGKISLDYIKHIFNPFGNNFSGGYIYYDNIESDSIISFIVWSIETITINDENIIPKTNEYNNIKSKSYKRCFIKLICSNRTNTTLGYKMLDDVENYCIRNTIYVLKLEAINQNLENYYEKFGFIKSYDNYNPTIPYPSLMIKPIILITKQKNTNYKPVLTRRQRKKLRDTPKIIENTELKSEIFNITN
jgi:hypothetical protein